MTEQEWQVCTDPDPMFDFLRSKDSPASRGLFGWLGPRRATAPAPVPYRASNRKVRLLACVCCRRIWELLYDERSREAVAVSERFADGLADTRELAAAREAAESAAGTQIQGEGVAWDSMSAGAFGKPSIGWRAFAWAARAAAEAASLETPDTAVSATISAGLEWGAHANAERIAEKIGAKVLVGLMRDLFGFLPFRLINIPPDWMTWNDATIPKLSKEIYEVPAFDRLPILADALEEAGCNDADILNHCRRQGEHVRGCWAVDLLLGKS
jgi:hypothetical protein